jgi:anti-anti-sigma regulatory factor
MVSVAGGYELDVDRGPNWLFVRVQPVGRPAKEATQIADEIWSISSKHFIYRLVLEMDEFDSIPEDMMGQIVELQERLAQHGGSLKLCGLSPECAESLHERQLDRSLPTHGTRADAVLSSSTLAM